MVHYFGIMVHYFGIMVHYFSIMVHYIVPAVGLFIYNIKSIWMESLLTGMSIFLG